MAKRPTKPCKNCDRPVAVRHEREGLTHIIWDRDGNEFSQYGCRYQRDKVAE